MEREIIKSTVESLPYSTIGEVQQDHEIWEEFDGGAKVTVTRHYLPTPNRDSIVAMTVSGEASERHRVEREFIEVFGDPVYPIDETEADDYVCTVAWFV